MAENAIITRRRARRRRLGRLGQVGIESIPQGAGETVPPKQFNKIVLEEFFKDPDFKELFDLSAEFLQRTETLKGALKIINQQLGAGIIGAGTHSSQAATARNLIDQYNSKAGEINRFLTKAHAETRVKTGELLTEKGYSVDPSLYVRTSGLGAIITISVLVLVALAGIAATATLLGAASFVRAFRADRVGLVKAQNELANTILAQTPDADKGNVARTLAGKVPGEDKGLLIMVGIAAAIAAAIAIFK